VIFANLWVFDKIPSELFWHLENISNEQSDISCTFQFKQHTKKSLSFIIHQKFLTVLFIKFCIKNAKAFHLMLPCFSFWNHVPYL